MGSSFKFNMSVRSIASDSLTLMLMCCRSHRRKSVEMSVWHIGFGELRNMWRSRGTHRRKSVGIIVPIACQGTKMPYEPSDQAKGHLPRVTLTAESL